MNRIIIPLSKANIVQCKEWAKAIYKNKRFKSKNSSNFIIKKEEWYRIFVGNCGEKAYEIITGQSINEEILLMGDDGYDFPDGCNVKASERGTPPNLMWPVKQWNRKAHLAKFFVLAWVRPLSLKKRTANHVSDVEIMGRISYNNAKKHRELLVKGHPVYSPLAGPTYFVSRGHLDQMGTPSPCKDCYYYGWKGLTKWCFEHNEEIDTQWEVGCIQYRDMYAKK